MTNLHQGLIEQVVATGTVFSVLGGLQREYERRLIQSRITCSTEQVAARDDLHLIEAAIEAVLLKKIERTGNLSK